MAMIVDIVAAASSPTSLVRLRFIWKASVAEDNYIENHVWLMAPLAQLQGLQMDK